MRGADTVNDEFEVGFNQHFEAAWYRAALVGRMLMIGFVVCAGFGLLGRGPYSHRSVTSEQGDMRIDYEPIARHSTATMLTVHLQNHTDTEQPLQLTLDQHVIEPMGYQRATPLPDSTSAGDAGIRLGFMEQPHQNDVLIRFNMAPSVVGLIPLQITNGHDTARWTMLVVP